MTEKTALAIREDNGLPLKKKTPKIDRIVCVMLPVKKLEKARQWCEEHLGICFDGRPYQAGGVNFALTQVDRSVPSPNSALIWETSDLAHAFKVMKESGVNVLGDINWECRYFVFTDLDGNKMTMWQQDVEAILRLSDIETAAQLQVEIKRRLFLSDKYGNNWDSFREVLLTCKTIRDRRIVAVGWSRLVERLPQEADMLKTCIKEHNANYPSHEWILETRD